MNCEKEYCVTIQEVTFNGGHIPSSPLSSSGRLEGRRDAWTRAAIWDHEVTGEDGDEQRQKVTLYGATTPTLSCRSLDHLDVREKQISVLFEATVICRGQFCYIN